MWVGGALERGWCVCDGQSSPSVTGPGAPRAATPARGPPRTRGWTWARANLNFQRGGAHLRDVARRAEAFSVTFLASVTGELSPEGDSTVSIGSRARETLGAGPRLRHLVDLLVLLTFSTIQLVTMSQPWGP